MPIGSNSPWLTRAYHASVSLPICLYPALIHGPSPAPINSFLLIHVHLIESGLVYSTSPMSCLLIGTCIIQLVVNISSQFSQYFVCVNISRCNDKQMQQCVKQSTCINLYVIFCLHLIYHTQSVSLSYAFKYTAARPEDSRGCRRECHLQQPRKSIP